MGIIKIKLVIAILVPAMGLFGYGSGQKKDVSGAAKDQTETQEEKKEPEKSDIITIH